jgi:hypothetical protein
MQRLLILFAAGILTVGCTPTTPVAEPVDDSTPATTADKMNKEVKEAADAVAEYTDEKKEELVKKFDEKLTDLDAEIAKLEVKAEDAKEESKEKLDAALVDLREKRKAAAEKLEKLKASSADAWEETKTGFQKAWNDLESSYKDAAEHFDGDKSTEE